MLPIFSISNRSHTVSHHAPSITQPALSRHITTLEEETGAQLFERTTRNVVLTPAGEAVYKACRDTRFVQEAKQTFLI